LRQQDKILINEKGMDIITKLLLYLQVKSAEGASIIVEGKKDSASLRKIGITGKIVQLKNCNLNLQDFIYSLDCDKEVIIMTDFDREGETLATILFKELTHKGVKTNRRLRIQLKNILKHAMIGIEEIANYIECANIKFGRLQIHQLANNFVPNNFELKNN
jgi:5S rRNA maturation endonuclease (ribonuclease M5)